uniref:SFRICE_015184 n=1 Tax=Spodoptera frugiperda TaxID=7108 RepID=A0A2H1VC88_SPOFR
MDYATSRILSPKGKAEVHITARNAAIQCTPTLHHLCYKSHVIRGEPNGHKPGTSPDSMLQLRNFLKKPNNTLPDSGIEAETSCPAVALATTRPTKQSYGLLLNETQEVIVILTEINPAEILEQRLTMQQSSLSAIMPRMPLGLARTLRTRDAHLLRINA